jgi:hypothetical protein
MACHEMNFYDYFTIVPALTGRKFILIVLSKDLSVCENVARFTRLI